MAPRKEWDDDDGRVIADMSGIERSGLIVPKIRGRKSSAERKNESEFTPQERRMYALGALKAALLIALAFIVGLGAAIWLMLLAWT